MDWKIVQFLNESAISRNKRQPVRKKGPPGFPDGPEGKGFPESLQVPLGSQSLNTPHHNSPYWTESTMLGEIGG
jgi:hypothetical protein